MINKSLQSRADFNVSSFLDMSTSMSWYYKPTNSPRYPGLFQKDPGFTMMSFNRPTSTVISPRHGPGRAKNTAGQTNGHLRRSSTGGTIQPGQVMKKSPEEYRVWLHELKRPTASSIYKFHEPKNTFHFNHRYISVDGTIYKWQRMDIMKDTYKSLWNSHGTVKKTFSK